ncbi:MAG: hypothetical protein MUE47_10460 [Acidobacteria bacterium]|nr:hypothetical protein [Acidobacteriota bacterium]
MRPPRDLGGCRTPWGSALLHSLRRPTPATLRDFVGLAREKNAGATLVLYQARARDKCGNVGP